MPSEVRVLALDLGTTTGWAVDRPRGGDEPLSGAVKFRFPKDEEDEPDLGAGYAQFYEWLGDAIKLHAVDLVCWEAPVPVGYNNAGKRTFHNATLRLYGMAAITELVAKQSGCDRAQAHLQTVRAYFTGNGRSQKHDVLAECSRRGWVAGNHNQGDALALWAAAKSQGTD